MKKKYTSLKILSLLSVLFLGGCGYRFAIVTNKECSHPTQYREDWGGLFQWRWYNWYLLGFSPRLNPLHWHNGLHLKCDRCGQKFCEHWVREKWINKVEKTQSK